MRILIPLRHPETGCAQHTVQRAGGDVQFLAGLRGLDEIGQPVHRRIGQTHAVAGGVVGGDRGIGLFHLAARLIAVHRVADDHVEIEGGRVAALAHLRRIDQRQPRIDAQRAQVFDIGGDDALKAGAVFKLSLIHI